MIQTAPVCLPRDCKMAEETNSLSSKWKFYNIIILGLGFFLLFTAFQTTANVQVRSVNVRTSSENVCPGTVLECRV